MGEGRGGWAGQEASSTHCLDHKEKPGLVPSFATAWWHSGMFQALPFPAFLRQGASPVGSSVPGRFGHPGRPRARCAAAPGQAEELLLPSSSTGTGREGQLLDPLGKLLEPSWPAGTHPEHPDTAEGRE